MQKDTTGHDLQYVLIKYTSANPVATRSKAWACGCSLAGIAGSNPAGEWMSVSL